MIAGLRAGHLAERRRAAATAGRGLPAAAVVAELALVALCGVLAALLIWTVAAPESAVPVAPSLTAAPRAASDSPAVSARDWSVLWRANPFAPASGAAPAEESAPETTLNLTLFGARTAMTGVAATAYVKTPDGRQGAYREGQEIIPGVTLEQVLANRAVISRGGVRETLYLDGARRPAEGGTAASLSAGVQPAPGATFHAEDIYDAAQFEGVVRQGRLVGIRIQTARNPELLARAGLAEGDVLISIDGVPAAELGGLANAFEELEHAEGVTLVIERDGAQRPLTIDFGTPAQ